MLGGNTAGAQSGLKVTLFNIAGYAVPGLLLSIDQIAYECCSFDSRGPSLGRPMLNERCNETGFVGGRMRSATKDTITLLSV